MSPSPARSPRLSGKYPRHSFVKKFLASGLLTPVAQNDEDKKSPHAPIQYRFNEAGYTQLREKLLRC